MHFNLEFSEKDILDLRGILFHPAWVLLMDFAISFKILSAHCDTDLPTS